MPAGKVCALILIGCLAASADSLDHIAEAVRSGQSLQSQGRLGEAEQFFKALAREVLEEKVPAVVQAHVLTDLASVEIDLTRMDEAERLYRQALKIAERGADSDAIVTISIQLAELYLEAEQIETAEKLLLQLMKKPEIQRASAEKAFALDVLACVYANRKKVPEAITAEREALSILATLNNPNPATIAIATMHLSSFLNLAGKVAEALPYAQRAVDMFIALPLQQPAVHAEAEINLASIYARLGRAREAEAAADAGEKRGEHFYGPDHERTALILLGQAAVLRTIGKTEAAGTVQARANALLARSSKPNLDATVPVNALLPK
jgi:tetratricopeptide (TPR) repeat protein